MGLNTNAEITGQEVRRVIKEVLLESGAERERGAWGRLPGGGSVCDTPAGRRFGSRELGAWKTPRVERMAGASTGSCKLKVPVEQRRVWFRGAERHVSPGHPLKAVSWNGCHFSVSPTEYNPPEARGYSFASLYKPRAQHRGGIAVRLLSELE